MTPTPPQFHDVVGGGIVARVDAEAFGRAFDDCLHLIKVAGSFFHGDDVVEFVCKAQRGFGLHVHHAAAGMLYRMMGSSTERQ